FFFSSRRRHTRFSRDWSSDGVLFRSISSLLRRRTQRRSHLWFQNLQGHSMRPIVDRLRPHVRGPGCPEVAPHTVGTNLCNRLGRSEERRVGKEWRSRWPAYRQNKKHS